MRGLGWGLGVGLLLGCAGLPGDLPALAPERDASPVLPAPWSELGLPIGEGEVVSASEQNLSVVYERGDATLLAELWFDALVEAGWSPVYIGPAGRLMQLRAEGRPPLAIHSRQSGASVALAISTRVDTH